MSMHALVIVPQARLAAKVIRDNNLPEVTFSVGSDFVFNAEEHNEGPATFVIVPEAGDYPDWLNYGNPTKFQEWVNLLGHNYMGVNFNLWNVMYAVYVLRTKKPGAQAEKIKDDDDLLEDVELVAIDTNTEIVTTHVLSMPTSTMTPVSDEEIDAEDGGEGNKEKGNPEQQA